MENIAQNGNTSHQEKSKMNCRQLIEAAVIPAKGNPEKDTIWVACKWLRSRVKKKALTNSRCEGIVRCVSSLMVGALDDAEENDEMFTVAWLAKNLEEVQEMWRVGKETKGEDAEEATIRDYGNRTRNLLTYYMGFCEDSNYKIPPSRRRSSNGGGSPEDKPKPSAKAAKPKTFRSGMSQNARQILVGEGTFNYELNLPEGENLSDAHLARVIEHLLDHCGEFTIERLKNLAFSLAPKCKGFAWKPLHELFADGPGEV